MLRPGHLLFSLGDPCKEIQRNSRACPLRVNAGSLGCPSRVCREVGLCVHQKSPVLGNPPVSTLSSPIPLHPHTCITLQSSVLVFASGQVGWSCVCGIPRHAVNDLPIRPGGPRGHVLACFAPHYPFPALGTASGAEGTLA